MCYSKYSFSTGNNSENTLATTQGKELLSVNGQLLLREFELRFAIFPNSAKIFYFHTLLSPACMDINHPYYLKHIVYTIANIAEDLQLEINTNLSTSTRVSSATKKEQNFQNLSMNRATLTKNEVFFEDFK